MNEYLTKKLGEEGSEVAQAAFKVLLHHDRAARRVLLSEMADMRAMLDIAEEQMSAKGHIEFLNMVNARRKRERQKGKA